MKQLLEHFKELTVHPKNAEELKGLILQLAVQGKLTQKWRSLRQAQGPPLEPASLLLERIRAEKEQLIKAGKIKKEKPLPAIEENEISFKLPKSWAWSRLNDVCEYIQRGKSPKYTDIPKIPVISQKCVQWTGFDISKVKFISEESFEKYSEERILQVGDLLWNSTGDGTLGRVITYPGSDFDKVVADSHVTVVRGLKNSIIPDYLWVYSASPFIQNLVSGRVSGSTKQTELSTGTIKLMEFSLPPLEEQKAIVATVNQLFAEVKQLETLTKERIKIKENFVTSVLNQFTQAAEQDTASQWAFIQEHFGTFFTEKSTIKKLREGILQLAVQGKLTHHWRTNVRLSGVEVESAATLLEKIKAEKEQLIKEGKIKKEKPLPEISEEEIPYDLPEGWVWCRMEEISDIQRGSSPRPKGDPIYFSEKKTDHNWISIKDISKYSVNNRLMKTDEFLTELGIKHSRYVGKDELIVAVSGSTTGKCCLTSIEGYIYDGLAVIRLIGHLVEIEYQLIYMLQLYNHMNDSKFGAAFPNINTRFLAEMLFPLPPLEEQKSIVGKVKGLVTFCDQLEQEIENHQTTQEQWMESCLREVVK
ncbi:restriction endonuclease subunit S [Cyclobacterium plantarum]|uniref:restriction endonuclease subunit S n=1 Tax=Cyclobacterium plantarum TaxID=2716263 RepID=UPI003F71188D